MTLHRAIVRYILYESATRIALVLQMGYGALETCLALCLCTFYNVIVAFIDFKNMVKFFHDFDELIPGSSRKFEIGRTNFSTNMHLTLLTQKESSLIIVTNIWQYNKLFPCLSILLNIKTIRGRV